MPVGIENQAYGVLAGGITAAATTVSLQAGQGARFGVFPAGTFKSAQLIRTDNTVEYVKITGRSGDSLVVVRAQQGSTALTFSIGDRIEMCPDKGTMAEFVQLGLIGQSLVAAGTASAMTATLVSGGDAASLLDGFQVTVRAVGANVSTAPTFNLTIGSEATGAKTIVRPDGGALAPGDIRSPGFHMDLLYHAGTDRWMLRNPAAQPWSAGRNRLANGAFRHAQGNDGSPFVINNGAENDLQDCWTGTGRLSGGVFTVTQMGAGGPPGMPNYSRCTVTAADAAIPAGNAYWVRTNIEGFDIADLGFGTANAQPISVGFWFRSSLAGTFSGTVTNAAANRAYPFSFVYPAANVWQLVAVPNIPGDTVGTWPNNNVRGMSVNFCLGGGASTLAPAGSWQSGGLLGVTGTTNLMAVNGATFDLAAVQLESGVVCTPFEHVPFAVSFARCRRYVQIGAAIIRSETVGTAYAWISFDTPMRAAPSISMGPVSYLNASDATWFNANFTGAELTVTAAAVGGYALISNFTARARL